MVRATESPQTISPCPAEGWGSGVAVPSYYPLSGKSSGWAWKAVRQTADRRER